jgi:hypothetical protein
MGERAAGTALRIFGGCLLVAGVALGVFVYRSLTDAVEMGRFLARVGEALDNPIDAEDWITHWRANTVGLAILAGGGIVAGLGFVVRHRFAWALLAAALAADAAWLIAVTTRLGRKYPWESSPGELGMYVLLAAVSAWVGWRSRHRA